MGGLFFQGHLDVWKLAIWYVWYRTINLLPLHHPIHIIAPSVSTRQNMYQHKIYIHKLTHWKGGFIWKFSTLFNRILHNTSVTTFVTFLCVLNMKGAGVSIPVTTKSRFFAVNIYAIFLPVECKVISSCFYSKSCVHSNGYGVAHWMLSNLRSIN